MEHTEPLTHWRGKDLTVWRTDHVPCKVGQPVEDWFDAADKLQVFGFAGSLLDEEEDEAGWHEGHGEDHTDGDQNVHWCGHPGRGGREHDVPYVAGV